ncbi:MAG: hypothetical protein ACK4V1_08520 [Burkholderiaceae bacterium]
MEHDTPSSRPALSLQSKLDRIAHERDVLALMRELARAGLREGDAVRHACTGDAGRLWIDREGDPPRIVVLIETGAREVYSADFWRPA